MNSRSSEADTGRRDLSFTRANRERWVDANAKSPVWPGFAAMAVCLLWMVVEWRQLALPTPNEDAAMLFKYAENLARGGGISWNPGQNPGQTDGATDLGFVLLLAPLIAIGVPVVAAAIAINLAGVFSIGALIGILNNRLWHKSAWFPILVAGLLASGPISRYVLSGFSPPMMAFLLLSAFTLTALWRTSDTSSDTAGNSKFLILAGISAGLSGWWRPEGFALGPLAVICGLLIAAFDGNQYERRSVILAAIVRLLPPYLFCLLAWMAFRIYYFGHLLPASAVMKLSATHVNHSNAIYSVQFYGSLLLPMVGALVVLACGRQRALTWWLTAASLTASLVWVNGAFRNAWWEEIDLSFMPQLSKITTLVIFIPILAFLILSSKSRGQRRSWVFPVMFLSFSALWVTIATTMNWWGRMQWPAVPVLAALGITHIARIWNQETKITTDPGLSRARACSLSALTCVGILVFHLPEGDSEDGYEEFPFHETVAAALKDTNTSHVRLATTEAGLIPLAISGPSLDTYGLNNYAIATSGGDRLSDELNSLRPNLMTVHGPPPPGADAVDCRADQDGSRVIPFKEDWSRMTATIYSYAREHEMVLLRASETSACNVWSVWISADLDAGVKAALVKLPMPGHDLSLVSSPKE